MTPSDSKVFIVDDSSESRESVALLVRSMGLGSVQFASAEDFLAEFDISQSGCVVTDVRLLGMSGIELLKQMRVENITIPVVVVTAFADVSMAVNAMKQGATTFLEKPYRDQELWEAISEALAESSRNRDQFDRRKRFSGNLTRLSQGERDVMLLMVSGETNKAIARELDVSLRTVEARRHNTFLKMETESLAELVRIAIELQLFDSL